MLRKLIVLFIIWLAVAIIATVDFHKPSPPELLAQVKQSVLASNELTSQCAGPAHVRFTQERVNGYYTIYSYSVNCKGESFEIDVWLSGAEQEQLLFDVIPQQPEETST